MWVQISVSYPFNRRKVVQETLRIFGPSISINHNKNTYRPTWYCTLSRYNFGLIGFYLEIFFPWFLKNIWRSFIDPFYLDEVDWENWKWPL